VEVTLQYFLSFCLQTFPFFGVVPELLTEDGKVIEGEGEGYLVRTLGTCRSNCGNELRFGRGFYLFPECSRNPNPLPLLLRVPQTLHMTNFESFELEILAMIVNVYFH